MSTLVFKKLQQLKNKTFGLGFYSVSVSLNRFGFSLKYFNQPHNLFNFVLDKKIDRSASPRLNKFLQDQLLSNALNYNLSLSKQINRRIELLKFNRSWRGSRHLFSLPVRGQRTKTNARVQKSRRSRKLK